MQRMSGKIDSSWIIVALLVAAAITGTFSVLRHDTTGRSGSGLSEDYAYDLNELAAIDPNLLLYVPSGTPMSTGFQQSRAIAVDATGRLYIAGDKAIRMFSPAGDSDGQIDLSGEPRCLTIADDGKMYVGVGDHVEILDAAGQRVASWEPLGEEAVLTSIAKQGENVYVADAGHRVVLRYDTAGTLVAHIGEKDPDKNIPGFVIPSPHFDLAAFQDSLLRVANPGRNRIEIYSPEGDFGFSWGQRSVNIRGFCGCCNPVNFALLPDGWYVTAEKGLDRVKVYNSDGGFVGVVAGPVQLGRKAGQMRVCNTPEECKGGGLDVAAGADGRIYVLDVTNNVVRVFQKKEAGG